MSITFREIPDGLATPSVSIELDISGANRGLAATADVVVLVGQRTSSGEVDEAVPTQVLDAEEAATAWGRGSQLHRMAVALFTANNRVSEVWGVALDDAGSSVAAAGSFAFAASSLEAGTLYLSIGGDVVEVGVEAGDTAAEIATAARAAVNAQPDLPVVAAGSTNTCTITAKNAGTLGNGIDLSAEYSTSGLTTTVVAMASGATDPDLATALDPVLQMESLTILVVALGTAGALGDLSDHLVARSDGLEQRGAVGLAAVDTTISAAVALAAGVNDWRISLMVLPGTATWAPELAAAYAGVLASEQDLARPLNGLTLGGVAAPELEDRLTRAEKETLLKNGVTPAEVGTAGAVRLVRSVSTRTVDENDRAVPPMDIQIPRSLDYMRKVLRERLREKFGRVKIADRAYTENTTDPPAIRQEVYDVLRLCETQKGYVENVDIDGIIVERDPSNPEQVNCDIPVDAVNGLHTIRARMRLSL